MKFGLGKAYYIKFRDHCLTDKAKEKIVCEVMGWVHEDDGDVLTLSYWKTNSSLGDKVTEDDNGEYIQIIKSTIMKKKVLR
jgi:hypothetical protein